MFSSEASALGRNGPLIQTGLSIHRYNRSVLLRPVTSRDIDGRCEIEIPRDDLAEVIKILQDIKNEG